MCRSPGGAAGQRIAEIQVSLGSPGNPSWVITVAGDAGARHARFPLRGEEPLSQASVIIETQRGRVEGRVDAHGRRFLGIPFAAPPVGPLRFAPPQAPPAWKGVHDASHFGPGPIQPTDGLSRELGLLADFEQSEDCLTINVFTPAVAGDEVLPVMVWLHGGAFQTGTASGPVYDGSALARRGNVIVVTLNYRVGALGFLLPEAPEAANVGLQDQVAALRWVRDEIEAFGGDPGRVTVFGESAGAGSLVALLAMPASRGLIHRAILQSAAPEGLLTLDEAAERRDVFLSETGHSTESPRKLSSLSVDQIRDAQASCQEPGPRRIGMFFAPVVDGTILPQAPLDAIAAGVAAEIPLIVGTTAQEMQLYHRVPGFAEIPDAALPHYIASRIGGPEEGRLTRAEAVLAHYPAAELPGLDRFFAIETDASLFVPATRLATAQAAHQPATFMYCFTQPSPAEGGKLGACHALDVAFALGNIDRVPAFAGDTDDARTVEADMIAAWSTFAHSARPAEHDGWPPYRETDRVTRIFGPGGPLQPAPREPQRRAWQDATNASP